MAGDVAGGARVGVVPPGAAEAAGPLEDDEVLDARRSATAVPMPEKPLPTTATRVAAGSGPVAVACRVTGSPARRGGSSAAGEAEVGRGALAGVGRARGHRVLHRDGHGLLIGGRSPQRDGGVGGRGGRWLRRPPT